MGHIGIILMSIVWLLLLQTLLCMWFRQTVNTSFLNTFQILGKIILIDDCWFSCIYQMNKGRMNPVTCAKFAFFSEEWVDLLTGKAIVICEKHARRCLRIRRVNCIHGTGVECSSERSSWEDFTVMASRCLHCSPHWWLVDAEFGFFHGAVGDFLFGNWHQLPDGMSRRLGWKQWRINELPINGCPTPVSVKTF